jgi:hypothetical protein
MVGHISLLLCRRNFDPGFGPIFIHDIADDSYHEPGFLLRDAMAGMFGNEAGTVG